jgi:hypothetical protein
LPQYHGLVIDYIAESDSNRQQEKIRHRQQIYQYNQIPSVVLGPRDLDRTNWQQELYEKLTQSTHQPFYEQSYSIPYERK